MNLNNETDIGIKFTNKVTNERKVEKYREELTKIYGLLQAMDKGKILAIENATKTTTDALKEQNKLMKTNGSESQKMASNFNLAFNYTTLRTFTRALKNVASAMGNMVKQSAGFVENMNLLDVAFNNNTTEAKKFVNKLSEMYGLDESWGYRTVGIFKQLANAMNLSAEAGNKLSTIMPQLAIDVSSLYNINTNDAVGILTSALAGQTKPARRLGADITQTTLQQTLDTAGIKEYVANLTYAEKRLVIVASLLQQVSEANNDWGRTIDSVANQTRILSEQWDRLTRVTGNLFLPIVQKLLPYLNGILMVFIEIIKALGTLVGFDPADFDYFSEVDESVIDLQDGLEGANKSAKKLNGTLRSFDRLNNINTNKSGSGALGVGTGVNANIMKLFNDEVEKYNQKLTNVQMKAVKIRDSIMEWLGFTKQINKRTGEVSFKFDHITAGTVLGSLAIGGAIYKGIKTIYTILSKFNIGKTTKETAGAFSTLKSAVSGLLVGGASLYAFDRIMKDINLNGADTVKILGLIASGLGTIGGLAYAGFKVGGGWGALLGGLTGALLVLYDTVTEFPTKYSLAAGAIEKNLEKIDEYNQEVSAKYNNIQQTLISSLAEQEAYETLFKEMDEYIDKNGKIKEGYEDRVQFIAKQLKEAYGIELQIIDGTIKNYDKQIDKVKQLILEKKKQLVLESLESEYKVAITEKAAAYENVKKATQEATKAQKLYDDALADYEEKTKHYNPDNPFSMSIVRAKNDLDAANEALTKANQKVDDAKDIYASNVRAIAQYSKLYSMDVKTNAEDVEEYLNELENTYTKNGKKIKLSYEEQISDALWFYTALLKEVKENGGEINDEVMQQAEQRLKTLKTNLTDMTNSVEGEMGQDLIDAWTALGQTSETQFIAEFNKLNPDIKTQLIDKMYENGYQISKELQNGIDSLKPQIKFKTNLNVVEDDIKKLSKVYFSDSSPLSAPWSNKTKTTFETVRGYATGGLPSVGQLMYVNERGPELVGQVGGQSFVANQNQVVDFLQREIGNSKSGTPSVFNFYLDANNKLATYTLDKLQNMAKSNGQPIEIGG